ncbi:4Fe-4S single cluster domain-containing protein [Tenacibaculum agarivorans]|uniref:4Fe-4S single cluster domain-containing protein n=1 Tax=Tenacibaculum agarivorans TaxID=1908389 RepID=UPI00094B8DF1|nr:4Fe-4S single cluster domain-containing protein [Tenacibaculum agarivorans]
MQLNIHKYIPVSEVEGPGKRFVLWVQGCSIQCENCFVPHTWNVKEGNMISIDELYKIIMSYSNELEGITVFGGEPFDQHLALYQLIKKLKENTNLSVMIFSGYTYEHLKRRVAITNQQLLDLCDIFVDGPYIEKLHDLSRPWVGSSNQRYFFFTDRYKDLAKEMKIENKLTITIQNTGEVVVNGLAHKDTIAYLEGLISDY